MCLKVDRDGVSALQAILAVVGTESCYPKTVSVELAAMYVLTGGLFQAGVYFSSQGGSR